MIDVFFEWLGKKIGCKPGTAAADFAIGAWLSAGLGIIYYLVFISDWLYLSFSGEPSDILTFIIYFGLSAFMFIPIVWPLSPETMGSYKAWLLGLLLGLVMGSYLISPYLFPLWALAIIIIILGEVLFFLDKEKPKVKQSHLWFTVERKLLSLIVSAVAILGSLGSISLANAIYEFIKQNWQTIGMIICTIGIGTFVIIGIVIYIYLNSLKYRNVGKGKGRKKR